VCWACRAASAGAPPDARFREVNQAAASDGRRDYLTLNAQFHATINRVSGHTIAQGILEHFRHRPIDRFFPEPFRARPPTASVDLHERIAAAIAAGDVNGAEREMFEHLTGLVETLRGFERTGPRPGS
jgi:DNA-binding GntR family transcriptional regulator